MKLSGDMQLLEHENETYKIKEREVIRKPKIDKQTQTENKIETQTIDEIGGRKRRRIEVMEPEPVKNIFCTSDMEPWTSEGESRYTETEDDTCSDLIRKYRRTAKISHRKTETAIVSAKNTLKEIEETTDDGKQMEIRNTKITDTTMQDVLIELKSVIDKHLNKTEQKIDAEM